MIIRHEGNLCKALDKAEVGWKVYESITSQGGLWNASNNIQQHPCATFACVAAYYPERPKRTAII